MDQAGGRGATWRAKHTATVANLILISHTQGWPLLHTHATQPELPNQSTHTKPNQTTTKDDRSCRPSSSIIHDPHLHAEAVSVSTGSSPVWFYFATATAVPVCCPEPRSSFVQIYHLRPVQTLNQSTKCLPSSLCVLCGKNYIFWRRLCDIWYIYTTALSLDIILSTSLYPFVQHS